jgi:hypothetical protein
VVLEVNLHDLVGEAEHDCVTSAHPFFNIHNILHLTLRKLIGIYRSGLVGFRFFTTFKVTSEVLKQCDLLLQFLGVFSESIFFADILSICASSLIIVEMIAVRIKHDLGGVVKIDSCSFIGQVIPKTVFR